MTIADRASEAAILAVLQRHFPDHAILAEESGWQDGLNQEYLWAIDPLDGTTNYAHQYPFYAVSIGLLVAGFETTTGLIGNGMMCFARYPEQFEKLAANPELGPSAVEECLRFDPSIPITRRTLWEDTEFSGVTIPASARGTSRRCCHRQLG